MLTCPALQFEWKMPNVSLLLVLPCFYNDPCRCFLNIGAPTAANGRASFLRRLVSRIHPEESKLQGGQTSSGCWCSFEVRTLANAVSIWSLGPSTVYVSTLNKR